MDERSAHLKAEVGSEDRPRAGRHRFSLATLLLVPFVLSPLFLSVQWEAMLNYRPEVGILAPMVLAGIYGGILTFVAFNRWRANRQRLMIWPFKWFLFRGARYGAAFGVLFFVPSVTLLLVHRAGKIGFDWGDLPEYALQWCLGSAMLIFVAALSGAAAGGLLAAYFDLPRPFEGAARMQLPHLESAVVSRDKIVDYLLNPTHPQEAPKARFFSSHGFALDGWEILAGELRRLPANWPVAESVESEHGAKCIIDGQIDTPSGQTVSVRTIWIIDRGRHAPRLVTAYPHDKGA